MRKKWASYTAPTILVKDGRPVIGIGSAGGRRIPVMITEVLIRLLKYDQRRLVGRTVRVAPEGS